MVRDKGPHMARNVQNIHTHIQCQIHDLHLAYTLLNQCNDLFIYFACLWSWDESC